MSTVDVSKSSVERSKQKQAQTTITMKKEEIKRKSQTSITEYFKAGSTSSNTADKVINLEER